MGTAIWVGIGILSWVLLAVLVALVLARTIRLRDRQRPDHSEPEASAPTQQDTLRERQ